MHAKLQGIEIEAMAGGNHNLPIEDAARRQLREQVLDQFGEIAVQRLLVAALDQHFVVVAEDQRAESVPLRLEDPASPSGSESTRLASMGSSGGLTGRYDNQSC